MKIIAGRAQELPSGVLYEMARYRHRVFIQRLGWDLQSHGRLELDQFDRRDTLYVIAYRRRRVVGIARLLPTHRPYLLGEVFPQLLGELTPPRAADVWELSRFAAFDIVAPCVRAVTARSHRRPSAFALEFLKLVMEVAAKAGAKRLLSVSPLGIERILKRGCIDFERLGPVLSIDGASLVACAFDLRDASLPRGRDGTASSARPAAMRMPSIVSSRSACGRLSTCGGRPMSAGARVPGASTPRSIEQP